MAFGPIAIRLAKIVLTGGLALWAFLVTLGNATDYQTNRQFVQHVVSMDTIFPYGVLGWRALNDPAVQTVTSLAIISTEGLACLAVLAASVSMARRLTASAAAFRRAASITAVGVMLGFPLWAVGFMAVGGEWFAMWQSQTRDAQEAAFRSHMTDLAVGV